MKCRSCPSILNVRKKYKTFALFKNFLCFQNFKARASILEKHLRNFHGPDYEEYLDAKTNAENKRKAGNAEQQQSAKFRKVSLDPKRGGKQFSGKIGSCRVSGSDTEENLFETEDSIDEADDDGTMKLEQFELNPENGNMEFIVVSDQPSKQSSSERNKEEKFIQSVYPQFSRKTKLELIDHIITLQEKVKNYESTINRMLGNN